MADSDARFDLTGFHRFGAIAARLEAGNEPTDQEWDGLFTVPGYVALTQLEFKREAMAECLRLACSPARFAERDRLLADGTSQMLSHFVAVRRRWPELVRYAERLPALRLERDVVAMACRYLPPAAVAAHLGDSPPAPAVSFLIFLNDARGYEPVVVDVLMAAESTDRHLLLMLAHEFHHNFRWRIHPYDPTLTPSADRDLLWVIEQIHCEGVADLINVPEMFYGQGQLALSTFGESYRRRVDAAPEFLAKLNNTLSLLCGEEAPNRRQELGAALRRDLPNSGHFIGFYMASLIVRAGHERELIGSAADPFAFFELYDKVARSAGGDGLTDQAKQTLTTLLQQTGKVNVGL